MIETPEAARRAREIALEADFLSIGTNDLVSSTLELDRDLPHASAATAADPAVLTHIAAVVAAAHDIGITVEVCGEAAGVPELVVIFVGLGIDELSVAPARIDLVRGDRPRPLRRTLGGACARSARRSVGARRAGSPGLHESGDELRQPLEASAASEPRLR